MPLLVSSTITRAARHCSASAVICCRICMILQWPRATCNKCNSPCVTPTIVMAVQSFRGPALPAGSKERAVRRYWIVGKILCVGYGRELLCGVVPQHPCRKGDRYCIGFEVTRWHIHKEPLAATSPDFL